MFLRIISPVRQFAFFRSGCNVVQVASYKSQYSIENIYPNSATKLESPDLGLEKLLKSKKEFSGYVPIAKKPSSIELEFVILLHNARRIALGFIDRRLNNIIQSQFKSDTGKRIVQVSFSRCTITVPALLKRMEKVSSKVNIKFHVQSANWISDAIKAKLHQREADRITKDGYLVVSSEKTCQRILNQADCLYQLRRILFDMAADQQPQSKQLARKPVNVLRVKKSSLRTV